jgi:hypothetical protein
MKSHNTSAHRSYGYINHLPRGNGSRIPKPERRWEGGVEINTRSTPTLDVRFLCVAINYPYMLSKPQGELKIERQWSSAFTLTCIEIDALLGQHKCGFRWTHLDDENEQPGWHWSLDKHHKQKLMVNTGADRVDRVAMTDAGHRAELSNAIQAVVDKGMRRAKFFNQEASNSGEMQ